MCDGKICSPTSLESIAAVIYAVSTSLKKSKNLTCLSCWQWNTYPICVYEEIRERQQQSLYKIKIKILNRIHSEDSKNLSILFFCSGAVFKLPLYWRKPKQKGKRKKKLFNKYFVSSEYE